MISKIKLVNWKNHTNSEFQFKDGTNVLVGPMGSGKSSVLQAISYALFGTFAELKSRQLTQADLITRGSGATSSEVVLQLKYRGSQIIITRKIEAKGTEATVRDTSGKLLAGPSTTAVNEFVKQLLGIDEDIFLRTVYAMQNDIDMILKLSPKERKRRIDELMGLHKFERARDNCVTLRNRISRSRAEIEQHLSALEIEQLAERIRRTQAEIEELKSKQLGLRGDIEKKKAELQKSKEELAELRKRAEEASKLGERKNSIERQIKQIEARLSGKELKRSRKEIEQEIIEIRSKTANFGEEKKNLSSQIEEARRELLSREKRMGVLEQKRDDLRERLSKIQQVKEELSKLNISDLNKELSELRKRIDEKKEQSQALALEIKSLREHLQALGMATSSCPVCKRDLTEEAKTTLIAERKREIAQLLYNSTGLREELDSLEKRKEELEAVFDKYRYQIEDIEKESAFLKDYKEVSEELEALLKKKRELEKEVSEGGERLRDVEKKFEQFQARLNALTEEKFLYELKEQLDGLRKELITISQELEQKQVPKEMVERAEEIFHTTLRALQELETTEKSFEELLKEKEMRLKELQLQESKIKELQERMAKQEQQISFLDKLRAAIEAAQISLREELILAVNEVMTSVWLEIYPYEKWCAVRLQATENDYALQLKETNGDWVPVVGFASGGERMIAALAVRIAFARVLAPNLSLLILDEPTHNLDENAIKTLIEVIQIRVSDFLDQIFIITHEERLAEAAENVIRLG